MADKKLRVMCYGDSNTWGYVPGSNRNETLADDVRWAGIVKNNLKDDANVVIAGNSGRTTALDDDEIEKNGKKHLPGFLETFRPLDAIVLMLGTNDLKPKFKQTPEDIGKHIEELLDIIEKSKTRDEDRTISSKVLLMAPAPITDLANNKFRLGDDGKTEFGPGHENVISYSQQLGEIYREIAERRGVEFIDLAKLGKPRELVSDADGVHLTDEAHSLVAEEVEKKLRKMLEISTMEEKGIVENPSNRIGGSQFDVGGAKPAGRDGANEGYTSSTIGPGCHTEIIDTITGGTTELDLDNITWKK